MTLDEDRNVKEQSNIRLPTRFVDQFNTQLEALGNTLDFTLSQAVFETKIPPSPANQILSNICFFAVDDDRCKEPPTEEAIANAPPRPADPAEVQEGVDYRETLQVQRDKILNGRRNLELTAPSSVENYLEEQVNAYNTKLGEPFFLSEYALTIAPGDQRLKSVSIQSFRGPVQLESLEVISKNPAAVTIHSVSAQLNNVELFATGEKGTESTVLVNFRLPSDYRWITKSLRVRIE